MVFPELRMICLDNQLYYHEEVKTESHYVKFSPLTPSRNFNTSLMTLRFTLRMHSNRMPYERNSGSDKFLHYIDSLPAKSQGSIEED